MSKMWRIAPGATAIAVVVMVIVLPILGRWLVFRGNGVPFAWGLGPGRGMPFARGLQPGGLWPSTGIPAPFSICQGPVESGSCRLADRPGYHVLSPLVSAHIQAG
jgi:hypothetical protein